MLTVEDSYTFCRKIARTRARNFYYSFVLLSREKRDAMCAIYAFMRYCDDLSDDPESAELERIQASLARWREEMEAALQGQFSEHGVWPAFHDAVSRFKIPHEYFRDMISGVTSDLKRQRISTFEELYRYCYQVASVVGLTIIHIFGFESRKALALAEKCGIAFQLTNILRDVREDAQNGRIYLPAEELARFQVDPEQLISSEAPANFVELMQFQARRARQYYNEAMPLIGLVDRSSRSSLWALIQIYSRLLERIERSNFDVLRQRIRLSTWQKALIVLQAKWMASRVKPYAVCLE